MDLKYDIMKHPAVGLTADGGAEPYIHGQAKDAAYTVSLTFDPDDISIANNMKDTIEIPDADFVLLSEEEVEMEVKQMETRE